MNQNIENFKENMKFFRNKEKQKSFENYKISFSKKQKKITKKYKKG